MTAVPSSHFQQTAQFGKHRRMQVHSETPLNLESSLDLLAEAITPIEHFFLRNNHATPTIAPDEWALTIVGHNSSPMRKIPIGC